ncbi:MAG: hypothetical protein B7Y88_13835 [Sphingomonadales bacterium 32-64-17]|nr:MAG: hypothetical protein B7Y88_13835 [Sphingomonadales bacterium 32-64-17]
MTVKQDILALSPQGITIIAAAAHAANMAYFRSLGDDSQPEWSDAPDWQVSSAINGVEFHLANPDAGDAASHENWMKQKTEDGWKYGKEKDPEKKLHPCMVPFEKLPPEQQAKDCIFRAIVHATAPIVAGLETPTISGVDVNDALAALQEELDATKRQLAAQKGQVTRKSNQLEALEAKLPPQPRGFGGGYFTGKDRPDAAALMDAIADAGEVELTFTDPHGLEILGMRPRVLPPEAFAIDRFGRLQLKIKSLPVFGPQADEAPYAFAGIVMLTDGELLIHTPRLGGVLTIGAGRQYNLAGDVVI